MKPLTIPKDTSVYLGRPANPMAQDVSDAIRALVRNTVGIREAHLPQCYIKGIVEPPAQILVLVLDDSADGQSVLETVGQGLTRVLPPGMHIDVWPLDGGHDLLETVRSTGMCVHGPRAAEKKPWWKVFGGW